VRGQRHAPAALYPGKDTVPIVKEDGWAPGPVWTGVENLSPTGNHFRKVQPVASRYTDYATRPILQVYPQLFPVPVLGNVSTWVHCRIPVEFSVYKLLLLFLMSSLMFASQTLNFLAALQYLFFQHSYAPICYILSALIQQTVHICSPLLNVA